MLEGGGRTLEVRWICPGRLTDATIDWFNPFVVEVETREDSYLVGRGIQGLSVKIRGGTLLEIKVSSGGEGVLKVPGHAHGRSEAWRKWSFPVSVAADTGAGSADWERVGKHRRIGRFSFPDGERAVLAASASPDDETMCAVELTEVTKGVQPWWTLGFEATGEFDSLRGAIDATAELVFANPPPIGQLSLIDSRSYAGWLRSEVPDPSL